jgi:hypothetical protein
MAAKEQREVQSAPEQFGVVMLTADGEFKTELFATLDELVRRLVALVDHDVSVSCFVGRPLPISKPPYRHLLTPWGNKPLFPQSTDALEPDETGYLGVDPIHLMPPAAINVPRQSKEAADDEFFDDTDGDTIDIFNGVLPDPDS